MRLSKAALRLASIYDRLSSFVAKLGKALSASPNMGSIEVDHGASTLMWCALLIAPNCFGGALRSLPSHDNRVTLPSESSHRRERPRGHQWCNSLLSGLPPMPTFLTRPTIRAPA